MPNATQTRLDPTDMAQSLRLASIQPSTWLENDRSFEVVWTTGAAVTRFDWWDNEYFDETLSVAPGAVRLDRLQSGGPVLRDHIASTDNLIGSVVPGSVRLEKGRGIARVRLADTPDVADVVGKIRDGHLRSVSVGYIVHQYTRIERKDQRSEMRADDWEPTEISLTPVPADPGAQVRTKGMTMPKPIVLEQDDNADHHQHRDGSVYRNGSPSRQRMVTDDQILRACSRANLPREIERQLIADNEEKPMNEQQLFDEIIGQVVGQRNNKPINKNHDAPGSSSGASTRDLFADVLFARLSGQAPTEAARSYAGASMVDMARALLEERGEPVRWSRASAVIDALCRSGHHTTGDFTYLLNSAGQRFLVESFQAAQSPLKNLARPRTLPDFRKAFGLDLSGPTSLPLVMENGEFKRVTFGESKDSIQLHTYGGIFSITRQALVNDDLGAFADMAKFWSRAHAEEEATQLVARIAGAGAVLEDGVTLYHADHANIAASGSALTVVALDAGRQAMRAQKNKDGVTYANVIPRYLVVGPAKETEAEQVLATLAPTTAAAANPFSGKLELVVDPRLTGKSWRLFADPAVHPVLHMASLEGQEGLMLESRLGFDVDGVEFKARLDIGAAAWDHRGTYMNPGDA